MWLIHLKCLFCFAARFITIPASDAVFILDSLAMEQWIKLEHDAMIDTTRFDKITIARNKEFDHLPVNNSPIAITGYIFFFL